MAEREGFSPGGSVTYLCVSRYIPSVLAWRSCDFTHCHPPSRHVARYDRDSGTSLHRSFTEGGCFTSLLQRVHA